jgi:hypothetical protein
MTSRGEFDQRACHGDALLLSAGELLRKALLQSVQSDQLEHVGDALADLAPRGADDVHRKGDVLKNGLVVDQAEVLENDAERAAEAREPARRNPAQVEAVDLDLPGVRADLSGQQFDDRRLPAAAGGDQKDEFPLVDLQAQSVRRMGAGAAVWSLRHLSDEP